jgi:hypothetical protein
MHIARVLPLLVALAAPVTAHADRANASQHPRVGELAQFPFQAGSADLPIGSERELGEIAAWAQANIDGHVVIEGHADEIGTAKSNLDLSLRRADAVRVQLLKLGIEPEQIIVAGHGETAMGRRVAVWCSRASVEAIEARLQDRGAKTVRESPLLVRR